MNGDSVDLPVRNYLSLRYSRLCILFVYSAWEPVHRWASSYPCASSPCQEGIVYPFSCGLKTPIFRSEILWLDTALSQPVWVEQFLQFVARERSMLKGNINNVFPLCIGLLTDFCGLLIAHYRVKCRH